MQGYNRQITSHEPRRVRTHVKLNHRTFLPALAGVAALLIAANCRGQQDDVRTDLQIQQNDTLSSIASDVYTKALAAKQEESESHAFAQQFSPSLPGPGTYYVYATLDLPATSNTNPALLHAGASSSFEFNPTFQLSYGGQFENYKVTAFSAIDADRYSADSIANQDNVLTTVKMSYNGIHSAFLGPTPPNDVVPYALYISTIKQTDGFRIHKSSVNDVGFGFQIDEKALKLGNPKNCSLAKHACFSIDMNFTRRIVKTGDSISAYAKSTLGYFASDWASFSFTPNLRYRYYDEIAGVQRRDTTLLIPFNILVDPHWLDHGKSQIILSVTALKNWSNVTIRRASQWNVGPTIELVQVFH